MEYDTIRVIEETKKHDICYTIFPYHYDPEFMCVAVFLLDKITDKTYLIEKYYKTQGFNREVILKMAKKLLKRPKKYLEEEIV